VTYGDFFKENIKIFDVLANAVQFLHRFDDGCEYLVAQIHMKTMQTSVFRLLTGQDTPHYI